MEEQLKKLYSDPAKGLTNLKTFWERVKENKIKATYSQVKEFYQKEPTNQIYKEVKPKIRSSIMAFKVGEFIQADLMEIRKFKFKNSNFKYLLNVVDVYSRYAWSFPIKSKQSKEVALHLELVYEDIKKHEETSPQTLTTDSGKEFINKSVNKLNEKYNIKHYTIVSKGAAYPTRTAIVERFNRTLWGLIARYTETVDTFKFIDVLQDLIKNYNTNKHTGIQATPFDVYNKKQFPNQEIKVAAKFNIGDLVRIKEKKKKLGAKSYEIRFSRKIYKVVDNANASHKLYSIETNRTLQKKYQYDDLQLIPKDTTNIDNNNKEIEYNEIEKFETMKRKNKKEKLDVDEDTGKIVIPKKLVPVRTKRESKPVKRYGEFTK